MRRALSIVMSALALTMFLPSASQPQASRSAFLGFDRNDYPGDAALPTLRKTFSYTGYWLNNPPGAHSNTWKGKRKIVETNDFGFLVLFNGRLYAELKKVHDQTILGRSDAATAVAAAKQEGFPAHTIIFLDQEQGGRMLPEQRAYIQAWVDGVNTSGFRAGIYCSGITAKEDDGTSVITAEDIWGLNDNRDVTYWVTNDACPPSPGCAVDKVLAPSNSGIRFASVWQFAQSPKRADVAAGCPANYNRDGSCYVPGFPESQHLYVDLNTATSSDPSNGRAR
jgi:hypothetical protein